MAALSKNAVIALGAGSQVLYLVGADERTCRIELPGTATLAANNVQATVSEPSPHAPRGRIVLDPDDPARAWGIDEQGGVVLTVDSERSWSVSSTPDATPLDLASRAGAGPAIVDKDGVRLLEVDGDFRVLDSPPDLVALAADGDRLVAVATVEGRALRFTYDGSQWNADVTSR